MSGNMGWTTQSSFIPKESKKISIGQNSSLVDLKAKILEEKAKLIKKQQTNNQDKNLPLGQSYQKRKDLFSGQNLKQLREQNKGLEERLKRDEEAFEEQRAEDDGGQVDNRKIQFKLAEKQQVYEQLIKDRQSHIKGKDHLIDYEQKRWDQKHIDQQSDKGEKQFDYLSEMNSLNDIMARERSAWENEARREINQVEQGKSLGQLVSGSVKDSATAMIGEALAPLVKQRWDNILTSKEKEYLPEVLKDKERQQDLIAQAKKKRDQDRENRLQKIEELKKRRKLD